MTNTKETSKVKRPQKERKPRKPHKPMATEISAMISPETARALKKITS